MTSEQTFNSGVPAPSSNEIALPARKSLPLALALCAFSAVLFTLSFPGARLWPLVFVALVPFEAALHGQSWGRALLLGTLFGCIFQAYLMYWVSFFGPPAFIGLTLFRAYPYAMIGLGWASLSRCAPALRLIGSIGCWVFIEFYQTWSPLGATWGMAGHALARQTPLIQVCSLGGPWLLSALVVAVNLVVAETRRKTRIVVPAWICLLLAWLLSGGYGYFRLRQAPAKDANAIAVGSVQVNMGRDIKWDPRFAEIALSRLEELSMLASSKGARVILWPETSIPYRGFRSDANLTMRLGTLGRVTQSWLIVGSIEMMGDEEKHTLNSASLISSDGGFEGRYDKQRLVPMGEYLPYEAYLRSFKIFDRVMRYLPGGGNGILTCRLAATPTDPPRDLRIGLLICFESMVPTLSAQRARDGAQALAVATNDGWFGDCSAIAHHFEMAIFRAVESGLPVIQSGNTGISGVIDAYGRVLAETQPNEKAWVVESLQPAQGATLYLRLRDSLAWLGGLAWLFIVSFCRPRQGREDLLPKPPAH